MGPLLVEPEDVWPTVGGAPDEETGLPPAWALTFPVTRVELIVAVHRPWRVLPSREIVPANEPAAPLSASRTRVTFLPRAVPMNA